jgi:RNA polymerase sigma factor (sigma-70 family)
VEWARSYVKKCYRYGGWIGHQGGESFFSLESDLEELESAAMVGLAEAVNTFDPAKSSWHTWRQRRVKWAVDEARRSGIRGEGERNFRMHCLSLESYPMRKDRDRGAGVSNLPPSLRSYVLEDSGVNAPQTLEEITPDPDGIKVWERAELRLTLEAALALLPKLHAGIIRARFLEGESVPEAARRFKLSQRSLAYKQKEALAMLRERLEGFNE